MTRFLTAPSTNWVQPTNWVCCQKIFTRRCGYATHLRLIHGEQTVHKKKKTRTQFSCKFKAMALWYRQFTLERGLNNTDQQVAEELGIPPSCLSKWHTKQFLWYELYEIHLAKLKKMQKLQPSHASFPEAADELFGRFTHRRRAFGLPSDGYWPRAEMLDILKETKPKGWKKFKCSKGWLYNWVNRYNLSSQVKTDKKSNSAFARLPLIMQFFDQIRRAQLLGPACSEYGFFDPRYIWNCDQIPMPFALNPRRSYNPRGQPCWIAKVGPSGLDKRQCTVHLTLRAEGDQIVPPVIIFRGLSCPTKAERAALDKLKNIRWAFQPKAWADQYFSGWWLQTFIRDLADHDIGSKDHMLIMDNLSAQRMHAFQEMAMKSRILPVYTSPGCTDVLQPVDHHVGAWLKYMMGRFYATELELDLNNWRNHADSKALSSTRRRIFMATWLDLSWQILKKKAQFIRSAFESTGCLIKLDGTHNIKIRQLEADLIPTFQPLIEVTKLLIVHPFHVVHVCLLVGNGKLPKAANVAGLVFILLSVCLLMLLC